MDKQTNNPAQNPNTPPSKSQREKYLDALVKRLHRPEHKRIVEAYRKGDSVKSMEDELAAIVSEIARHEDKKDKN